jgi:hypothetical protein
MWVEGWSQVHRLLLACEKAVGGSWHCLHVHLGMGKPGQDGEAGSGPEGVVSKGGGVRVRAGRGHYYREAGQEGAWSA